MRFLFITLDYKDEITNTIVTITHNCKDWWWQDELLCLLTHDNKRRYYHKDIIRKLTIPEEKKEIEK